jgi:predicted DNA-binding transcriptional regulator YafY
MPRHSASSARRTDQAHPPGRTTAGGRLDRATRLIRVLKTLSDYQVWSTRELARGFRVAERTILRDFDVLLSEGQVQRVEGKQRGYRLSPLAAAMGKLPPLSEVLSLLCAVQLGWDRLPEQARQTAAGLVTRLVGAQPAHCRAQLEALQAVLREADPEEGAWLCSRPWLALLVESLASGSGATLGVTISQEGSQATREVVPHHLEVSQGRIWLIASQIGAAEHPPLAVRRIEGIRTPDKDA